MRLIQEDEDRFEEFLQKARQASQTAAEQSQISIIEEGYLAYKAEQARLRKAAAANPEKALAEAYKAADTHQVRLMVVEPCLKLMELNQDKMGHVEKESQRVSHDGFMAMLFLGLAGPAGGLLVGYGVTRGFKKSIYRLSVRVQDMAQQLDRNVGSVSLVADGDIQTLEEQMKFIVHKVEVAAKQLQEQERELLRTEQLSQVGQLAAGVAHEIRNPLTGIKMLVEAAAAALLAPAPQRGGPAHHFPRDQAAGADRAELSQLCPLANSPNRSLRSSPHHRRRLGGGSSSALRKQEVQLKVSAPSQPVVAAVDQDQLTTVLVNLFLNALDVVGKGGLLEARLSRLDNSTIALSILDNGPGIPKEIMARVFQPFATNKPHGTGLGLYLSARILEEHGGSITAANRPEGGACFSLKLPAQKGDEVESGGNP